MTADLGPGTLLICVDALPVMPGANYRLTKGALYTCEAVVDISAHKLCPRDGCGTLGIKLRERQPRPEHGAVIWCPNRFKPLGSDPDEALRSEPEWWAITMEDQAERLLRPVKPEPVTGGKPKVRLPSGYPLPLRWPCP